MVRACQAAILSFLWQQLLTCLRDVGEDDAVEALKAHYLVGVDCEVQAPQITVSRVATLAPSRRNLGINIGCAPVSRTCAWA